MLKNGQDRRSVTAVNLSVGGMGLKDCHIPAIRRADRSRFLPPTAIPALRPRCRSFGRLEGRAGATFVVIDPAVYSELQEWTNQRMKEEGWELPL